MKPIVRILPALFVALGLTFAVPEPASAAPKKKPVATKKVAKHKARVVRKRQAATHPQPLYLSATTAWSR